MRQEASEPDLSKFAIWWWQCFLYLRLIPQMQFQTNLRKRCLAQGRLPVSTFSDDPPCYKSSQPLPFLTLQAHTVGYYHQTTEKHHTRFSYCILGVFTESYLLSCCAHMTKITLAILISLKMCEMIIFWKIFGVYIHNEELLKRMDCLSQVFELWETGTVSCIYLWRYVVSNLKSVSVCSTQEAMENTISIKFMLSEALQVKTFDLFIIFVTSFFFLPKVKCHGEYA